MLDWSLVLDSRDVVEREAIEVVGDEPGVAVPADCVADDVARIAPGPRADDGAIGGEDFHVDGQLRASEILGLARSDINLDRRTVTIRYQITGSGRRARRVETKTAASAATIPLPSFIIASLRQHIARQNDERPVRPIGDWLMFVSEAGFAVNGSAFTKHFQAVLARAGLPRMRLHDMRHGAVSLLVDAGAHPGSLRSFCATLRAAG
jgi:site-specific recombinase XerC